MTIRVGAVEEIEIEEAVRQRYGPFFGSNHAPGGRFANPWGVNIEPGPRKLLRWRLGSNPWAAEKRQGPGPIPREPMPAERFRALGQGGLRVMWLGHATALVAIDDLTLLIDPIFGRAGGVVARAVEAPLLPEALPEVDAVLLSHGHYDHCDRSSLQALARRFGGDTPVLLGLGLGRALPRECQRFVELDWWQSITLETVRLTFVPAQHWYRRSLIDTNRALWGGWWIEGAEGALYHSGDTGFFDEGFDLLREVFGAPDVAMLPTGAYEPRWFMGPQHMPPEDSARAAERLGARQLIPIHWGTFDLSDEPLCQGLDLLEAAIEEQSLDAELLVRLEHGGSARFDAGARTA